MKLILALLLFLLITSQCRSDQVASVHDGDTLTLADGRKIRLAGIDAPEISQPLGRQSRDHLKRLVIGRNITVVCRSKSYQRAVCDVYDAGRLLNLAMVQDGWAYDYPTYSKGKFKAAEEEARKKRRGIWRAGSLVKPWDYRHGRKRNANTR